MQSNSSHLGVQMASKQVQKQQDILLKLKSERIFLQAMMGRQPEMDPVMGSAYLGQSYQD